MFFATNTLRLLSRHQAEGIATPFSRPKAMSVTIYDLYTMLYVFHSSINSSVNIKNLCSGSKAIFRRIKVL